MFKKIIPVVVAVFVASFTPAFADEIPSFNDYGTPKVIISEPVPLVWDKEIASKDVVFKYTTYEEAVKTEWRKFGGKYIVLSDNCGVGLQCRLILDIIEGKPVARMPLAEGGYDWHANSRLLLVNPPTEENLSSEYIHDRTTYWYEWTGEEFKLLHQKPWSSN